MSVGFNASGLASAIASFVLPQDNEEGEKESDGGSFFVILVSAVLLSSGLSNLVSNVATANIVLPLLTCVAVRADSHPWLILIPATLACSFAFLFPVSSRYPPITRHLSFISIPLGRHSSECHRVRFREHTHSGDGCGGYLLHCLSLLPTCSRRLCYIPSSPQHTAGGWHPRVGSFCLLKKR